MNKEVLKAIKCIKKENSILFNSEVLTSEIRDLFYNSTNFFETGEVEYFTLTDYCVLTNDMIIGVKYQINENDYYLMIGSNSFFAPIEQMAIGKAVNGQIYMMQEQIENPGTVNFISFPENSINAQTKGFVPKSFRDSLSWDQIVEVDGKTEICLESGLEAFSNLKELVKRYNRNFSNSEDLIKRKKMVI